MKAVLLILATLLSVIGTFDYILSILNGKTRPHRTTRMVLFIVSVVNLLGTIAAHAGWGVLLLSLLFFVRSFTLAILSLKKGIGGTSKIDIICGVIALLGIVAWQVSGSGIWALIFAIFADAVAYVPAVIKTWELPKSEAPFMYWMEGVAVLLAIAHDGFVLSIIFQAYILLSCAVMLFLIYRPSFSHKKINS